MTGAGPDPTFLRAFAETRAFLLGRPSRIQVTPGGDAVLYLQSPPRDPTLGLYELDVASGQRRELVTPADLPGASEADVPAAEKARRERMRVTERGFTSFVLSPDGARVLLPYGGRLFLFDRATRAARALVGPEHAGAFDPRFSPDGARVAFVREQDLFVVDVDRGPASVRALTTGGTPELLHGIAEFVAQEEMQRWEGYWWAPDGRSVLSAEVDQRAVERFAIADPARPERHPQVFAYPRAGRANARVRLCVLAVEGEVEAPPVWLRWDEDRYPYLARVLWDAAAPLTLLVQTRDQREAALLAADPRTGETRLLFSERDEAWLNLDRDLPRWLPDGSGLLWASERAGDRALELRRPDGALMRTLVEREFLSLPHVDPGGRHLHVLTGDALTNTLWRIDLSSGARVALTSDVAEHAPVFARGGATFVDTRVAADALPAARVHDADGRPGAVLPATAEAPPFLPNLELCTVGGAPGFHAALVRPRDFQPGRHYPVLVHVYGGPHALMVKADQRQYLLGQWIADHGAIVVSIDNRGTPRRGRGFERAIKGSFEAVPLADQVEGLRALGSRFPELDLGRVGIFGWSFGGYMAALAVLRRPDLFKVAAAGAPVVDWLDYDTHYTERYLDLPDRNPEGYRASSLLTYASGLERPLLLVHGTADDNVYFFHSLKLADALLRAGRPFEFLPLAGVTHQVPDPDLRERLWQRMTEFLLRHL